MKKNSFLITLLAVIFHLSFSVPSASAAHKQRHHRHQGQREVQKLWVPSTPNYKKVMIPGHYNRLGKGVIGHWIRIVNQPGHWTKTWVWVANR